MKREFNKISLLTKADFDKAGAYGLPFLIRVHDGQKLDTVPAGVKLGSNIGTIYTANLTYDGAKALDSDPRVRSFEYSRPGGSL